MSCSTCRFSRHATQIGNTGLYCRADLPKNMVLPPTAENPRPMLVALWPEVDESAWCGKFEPDPMARTQ